MKIDSLLLDNLTAQAQASPRLRMNLDLRNSDGAVEASYELSAGGPVSALNIPSGQWHTLRALESGTVILILPSLSSYINEKGDDHISHSPKFTPRIHARITFVVRTSLAGISALPKVHLTHVLLPWLQRYGFSSKIKALK